MPCCPRLVCTTTTEVSWEDWDSAFGWLVSDKTYTQYTCLFQFLDNADLGTACGKYFRVGCLSITDAGDSDIIAKSTE